MTNDDAKRMLRTIRDFFDHSSCKEALDIALRALADKEWFEERERYLRGYAGISGDYRRWLDAWDKDHPRPAP